MGVFALLGGFSYAEMKSASLRYRITGPYFAQHFTNKTTRRVTGQICKLREKRKSVPVHWGMEIMPSISNMALRTLLVRDAGKRSKKLCRLCAPIPPANSGSNATEQGRTPQQLGSGLWGHHHQCSPSGYDHASSSQGESHGPSLSTGKTLGRSI